MLPALLTSPAVDGASIIQMNAAAQFLSTHSIPKVADGWFIALSPDYGSNCPAWLA